MAMSTESTSAGLRGHTVHIGADCGVQFASGRDLTLRVTVTEDSKSWDGIAWITGYVLNHAGQAIERREVYVIVAGLTILATPAPPAPPVPRPARNSRPMVPRPRTPSDTTVTTAGRTR
jgi:hypothetical protein